MKLKIINSIILFTATIVSAQTTNLDTIKSQMRYAAKQGFLMNIIRAI